MEHTIELARIDQCRSLVLWVTNSGHRKFVVCSYYNPTIPVGEQWSWGHYFDDLFDAVEYAKGELA